ncbi:MAG: RNA-directed DNA polymerase [Candidatus Staskawiczbacteria bacterium]|nr:RNA-directed DNA polymerase [Candidatus Staskawiczbacteria bacterium]
MSEIFNYKKLYLAYLACRKTKRKTINALKFEYTLERNIFLLQKELETKNYKPGRSICFVVKNPSPREIFAAGFRDRVVHHLLVREIEKIGERKLIFDTFSCRKKKGTHLAVARQRKFIKIASSQASRNDVFYLKLDISGFFMAINHDILYSLFEKLILKQNKPQQWKDDILWLAKVIIFHKPTENYIIKSPPVLFNLIPQRKSLFGAPANRGLPIGNYSSQFFANLYLNELDQFIKRNIECKYYVRYVDDFILLGKNKMVLAGLESKINQFLKNKLDLELNLSKTKFFPINRGVEFLGYFVKSDLTLVKNSVVSRFKNKLYNKEMENAEKILAMINSYYGHFGHAFSFNLRKDIFKNHLGGGA